MNEQRLLQLADFLDALPPEKFDFSKIVMRSRYVEVAMDLFGLSLIDAVSLFSPSDREGADHDDIATPWLAERLYDDAKPTEVATSIRAFVAWKKAQAVPS